MTTTALCGGCGKPLEATGACSACESAGHAGADPATAATAEAECYRAWRTLRVATVFHRVASALFGTGALLFVFLLASPRGKEMELREWLNAFLPWLAFAILHLAAALRWFGWIVTWTASLAALTLLESLVALPAAIDTGDWTRCIRQLAWSILLSWLAIHLGRARRAIHRHSRLWVERSAYERPFQKPEPPARAPAAPLARRLLLFVAGLVLVCGVAAAILWAQ